MIYCILSDLQLHLFTLRHNCLCQQKKNTRELSTLLTSCSQDWKNSKMTMFILERNHAHLCLNYIYISNNRNFKLHYYMTNRTQMKNVTRGRPVDLESSAAAAVPKSKFENVKNLPKFSQQHISSLQVAVNHTFVYHSFVYMSYIV